MMLTATNLPVRVVGREVEVAEKMELLAEVGEEGGDGVGGR